MVAVSCGHRIGGRARLSTTLTSGAGPGVAGLTRDFRSTEPRCYRRYVPSLSMLSRTPRLPHLDVGAGAEAVHARGVEKSFGSHRALNGTDISVPAGSLVALLGPSGCGKTTLLRTIAGLETPDRGAVEVGHRMVTSCGWSGPDAFVKPERRRIGMVFQDWALFPHMTVGDNVGFGLTKSERMSGRIEKTLALVDLADAADRMPGTLSGGQQQRVALARALANRPSVILLDEPFSNLDATLRAQIRDEVRRLLRDLGVTALFVTHDQEEAFAIGESVAVMFDGVVTQQAGAEELYEAPASKAVAEFIGDANFLIGRASGRVAETVLGAIPLRRDHSGIVEVMVRPEEVLVVAGDSAVVEAIEFYGHDSVYVVSDGRGETFRCRILATPEFRVGDRVELKHSGRPTVAFTAA